MTSSESGDEKAAAVCSLVSSDLCFSFGENEAKLKRGHVRYVLCDVTMSKGTGLPRYPFF
jgi:hypothetical protein